MVRGDTKTVMVLVLMYVHGVHVYTYVSMMGFDHVLAPNSYFTVCYSFVYMTDIDLWLSCYKVL